MGPSEHPKRHVEHGEESGSSREFRRIRSEVNSLASPLRFVIEIASISRTFLEMIHETGNRILDRLEQRFGRIALAQILRWIAGFQLLTWLLSLFSQEFLGWIAWDRAAILSGEVWRLFSWVIFPAATNVIFVLFALFFLFFINDFLESTWGTFRLNVYVVATIGMLALSGLILPWITGLFSTFPAASHLTTDARLTGPSLMDFGVIFDTIFYSSVFLAFATMFPEERIYLFGIIPIRAKWLGWLNVVILMMLVFSTPWIATGHILIGFIPYFLVFGSSYARKLTSESAARVRRHRFESEDAWNDPTFHECHRCGATEETFPDREFRVAEDGFEYCCECRKSATNGAQRSTNSD